MDLELWIRKLTSIITRLNATRFQDALDIKKMSIDSKGTYSFDVQQILKFPY